MKIICFDAEFANEKGLPEEILELSIRQTETLGKESGNRLIFHEYIKPARHRRWPHAQEVHHITPEMVAGKPGFVHWRQKIQQIIDNADYLVGFAIENDITALEREGIRGLDTKRVIDVRDLHWLQNTRHTGMELNSRKNLATTAEELGIEFSETLAHGADYDTRITLACFQTLIDSFRETEKAGATPEEILAHYLKRWEEERENYLREYARGWITLVKWHNGYRLKASRNKPTPNERTEASIEVKARYLAIDEIDAKLDKRRDSYDPHVYNLKPADIEWFCSYTNEYDGQEPLHRRMAELRAKAAKGFGNFGARR